MHQGLPINEMQKLNKKINEKEKENKNEMKNKPGDKTETRINVYV